jgi:hypothetical protein
MMSLIFKYEKYILKTIQCILQLNYSLYGGMFFNFNFDIN